MLLLDLGLAPPKGKTDLDLDLGIVAAAVVAVVMVVMMVKKVEVVVLASPAQKNSREDLLLLQALEPVNPALLVIWVAEGTVLVEAQTIWVTTIQVEKKIHLIAVVAAAVKIRPVLPEGRPVPPLVFVVLLVRISGVGVSTSTTSIVDVSMMLLLLRASQTWMVEQVLEISIFQEVGALISLSVFPDPLRCSTQSGRSHRHPRIPQSLEFRS
jgi:hypothetical protein